MDVVTFGEAMVMFVAEEPGSLQQVSRFQRALAGAEVNTAIGFARLGLKSGWVSKVGNDVFGNYILEQLRQEQVNIEQVHISASFATGFQLKAKVSEGDPEVQYFRKHSAASHLSVADFDEAYFRSAKHLHMTGIPLALSSSMREFAKHAQSFMRKEGKTISFDPNLRPALWTTKGEMIRMVNEYAFKSDYVLPGIEEGKLLTGYTKPSDIADFYLKRGVKLVVIKLGSKGAFYKSCDEEGYVPGYRVSKVVDTVGAGDGFAVGLISGILEGMPVFQAVMRGNAIGALAVQSIGDSDGYPNRKELDSFMQKYHGEDAACSVQ
ncbi:2-dehydro-3-deoxygluconokinase [Anoxybacillus sp. UARK-01]|uniref:sugar kinase n=1 Tax=Anoxybacillus sp. UARK-01 TaxID=1895648 RepID=UPI0009BC5813|nr:sugar kinase [Anoxybacillus sp. UARK-01]OQM46100.1 2-dehydro-3-deoxygluconokinase [Anoxybacillus sp. UARK-01]